MRRIAREILGIIKTIPGASEIGIEQEPDSPQLVVEVKREESARLGINVSDIQQMIEAAIGGAPIGTLYEDERRFDIVVRYSADYRSSVESIRRLLIPSNTGAKIPLSSVANIEIRNGETLIQREGGQRQISVRANIRGRDQGGFVAEA